MTRKLNLISLCVSLAVWWTVITRVKMGVALPCQFAVKLLRWMEQYLLPPATSNWRQYIQTLLITIVIILSLLLPIVIKGFDFSKFNILKLMVSASVIVSSLITTYDTNLLKRKYLIIFFQHYRSVSREAKKNNSNYAGTSSVYCNYSNLCN